MFARASDAAACALAVQRALTADAGQAIAVAYQPVLLPGPGLDRCAALARVAWAGQVLLSQASAALVADGLPAGADLADLGWHRLAGPGTRRARVAAAPSGPARCLPAAALAGRLPAQPAGRADQLRAARRRTGRAGRADRRRPPGHADRVRRLRQDPAGPARRGRTGRRARRRRVAGRAGLALATPRRWRRRLPTCCRSGSAGRTAGPPSWPRRSARANCCWCSTTASTSIRGCAEVADGLLRACPQLRILATSREPLGVPGEVTWRVPSLPFPAARDPVPPEDLARFEAVQLFAERARLARPRFALTGGERGRGGRDLRPAGRHPARHRAGRGPGPGVLRRPDRRRAAGPVPAADRRRAHRGAPPADPGGVGGVELRPAGRARAGRRSASSRSSPAGSPWPRPVAVAADPGPPGRSCRWCPSSPTSR